MSLYPDLDDVATESPVATKELAELRARVKELEETLKPAREVAHWTACGSDVDATCATGECEHIDTSDELFFALLELRKAIRAERALRGEDR